MGADPFTIAIAATQIFSAVSGFQEQKKAAKATKRANAAAMAQAELEAKRAKEDAEDRAREERLNAKRVRAQQLTQYMQSGVTLDGSPILVSNETREKGAQNAENILQNAEAEAESILLQGKANQLTVKRADFFGAAGQALGGASTIRDQINIPKPKGG